MRPAIVRRLWGSLFAALLTTLPLSVPGGAIRASGLPGYLTRVPAAELFPGADAYGKPAGSPPVAPVLAGGTTVGHVFLNSDQVVAVGYSGRPIHILVALDTAGVIRGARLVEHHEPIVLVGIPETRIEKVIQGYVGVDVTDLVGPVEQERDIDIVSGGTVTVMVIDDSILRSAIRVAKALGLGGLKPEAETPATPPATLRRDVTGTLDWTDLVAEGSVSRLKVTVAEVNRAFEASADPEAAARPEKGPPDDIFVDLYAALVSVEPVGRSLLGDGEFGNLQQALAPDQHALLLAGRGRYSFKGSGYVRGGLFDRFQLIQGDRSVRFRDLAHERLRAVEAEGAPEFDEVDRFLIPPDSGFDPTAPWRIELLVRRATGARKGAYHTFDLRYALPERYIQRPAPPPATVSAPAPEARATPLWHRLWRDKRAEVVVVLAALALLTVVFFCQGWLVRRPRLCRGVRTTFLVFSAVGLGFYANAQLSVVNILTVFNALITGFDWSYFLMEPLIFVLWGSVAASLLFWGRGAYCGWLCPFGALQELLNRLARRLRLPQWRVPWALHERLWGLKYLVFLALFGVSLHSLALAEQLAEVEPFKTVVILKFAREWPFVLFAGALLVAGLFVERFYCRYLCGLGAALAIPARMATFDWLKRYRQCGNPCQRCANECMVQAIHPEGHINPNECHYCLHCQELYVDEHQCPVMIAKRAKRERQSAQVTPGTNERIEAILEEVRKGRAQRDALEKS